MIYSELGYQRLERSCLKAKITDFNSKEAML